MAAWKQRAALAVLALVLVWPAVHFALYQRYGIDPWKLCGWAMYARPHAQWQIDIMTRADGRFRTVALDAPDVADEVRRLGRLRGALGELQSMDSLGELILAERPEIDGVRINMRRVEFRCRTAKVDGIREYTFDYTRDG